MSPAQHTPGPWRVLIDDDGNPLSGRPGVFASDELDCGIVHWDGFVQEYWRSGRGDKEIHANARLIAAAPELLAAAQDALQALVGVDRLLHEHGMMSGVECPAIAPLRAAIAAAQPKEINP